MATTVSVYCIMQGKGTRCVYIFMSFHWFVGTVFVHVCSIYKDFVVRTQKCKTHFQQNARKYMFRNCLFIIDVAYIASRAPFPIRMQHS